MDRQSAAARDAARKIKLENGTWPDGTPHFGPDHVALYDKFKAALDMDNGHDWARNLRDAGFVVWQAV